MPRKATGSATGSNPNMARTSEQARAARAARIGRPKGSTNKITTVAQLSALQKELGIPFEEAVAKTASKLYADFKMDKNVREWTDLLKHLSNKLTQDIPKEILIENPYQQMSADDIKDRLAELQAKLNGE
jgi:hypothetical protein